MNIRAAHMLITAIAAVTIGACGGASGTSPAETITTFLRSGAAGDSSTACAQMSDNAKHQMFTGTTCEDGMKLVAAAFGSLVKNVKVSDVKTQGTTASVILRYNGRPVTNYSLIKNRRQVADRLRAQDRLPVIVAHRDRADARHALLPLSTACRRASACR